MATSSGSPAADPASSELVRVFVEQRDHVFAYLLARTRDRGVAEDLLQEVAVALLDPGHTGAPADHSGRIGWILAIARNRATDHARRRAVRGRREASLAVLDEQVAAAFAEEADLDELRRRQARLAGCLERLGAKARRMIELRYHQDKDNAEIAALLSWGEDAVKVALSKARRFLQDCVARVGRAEGAP